MLMALPACLGCATIRKFAPNESHLLEARQLTHQAESAMHQQDWNNAEGLLLNAIERCPEDHRARAVLARVLWKRGAQAAAVEQLGRSIELSGQRDPNALQELGNMYLATGNHTAALRFAEEALGHNNMLADAWTLRGFALKGLNRVPEAMASFYRSLSIRNDDPQTRLEIARIYRESGDSQQALAILDPALLNNEGCPFHSEVGYLRGVLLRELDRPGDAIVALRQAQQGGCEHGDLLFHLAEAQVDGGELLQARSTIAEAEKLVGAGYEVAIRELRQRLDAEQSVPGGQVLR